MTGEGIMSLQLLSLRSALLSYESHVAIIGSLHTELLHQCRIKNVQGNVVGSVVYTGGDTL